MRCFNEHKGLFSLEIMIFLLANLSTKPCTDLFRCIWAIAASPDHLTVAMLALVLQHG